MREERAKLTKKNPVKRKSECTQVSAVSTKSGIERLLMFTTSQTRRKGQKGPENQQKRVRESQKDGLPSMQGSIYRPALEYL